MPTIEHPAMASAPSAAAASRAADVVPIGIERRTSGPSSVRLVAEHFAAAVLFLAAGAAGVVWAAPDLTAGNFLSPRVAAVTHLFTLGWITLTILGATAQLVPVALGTPLRSPRLARIALWILAPGIALFAAGVASEGMVLRGVGVAATAAGLSLALGQLAATLPRSRARGPMRNGLALGATFLAGTLVLGLVLAHNLETGFVAGARLRILTAHVHLALVGWALVVIVGVSQRLLPMFLVAHGADDRWSARALVALGVGVPILVLGLLSAIRDLTWVGGAAVEAGVAAFLWQALVYLRARRRRLDVGLRFAVVALAYLAVSAMLGAWLLVSRTLPLRLATAYVAVGLLGGISLYVVGHFYKIAPLLAWSARTAYRTGPRPPATAAGLYSARAAHAQLVFTTLGVALLACGILWGILTLTRTGALLYLAGTIIFVIQVARLRWASGPPPITDPKPS
jgi:hypothetical protein